MKILSRFTIATIVTVLLCPALALAAEGAEEPGTWHALVFYIINFALFVWIVKRFGGPQISAFFQNRARNIRANLGRAGEALQEAQNEDAKDIRSAKLHPLAAPDDLLVESYLNGRLYTVMDKNHHAPVILDSPDTPGLPWGMGEYWSRIGGKWYVVKRPE